MFVWRSMPDAVFGVVLSVVVGAVAYLFRVLRQHDQSMVQHATILEALQSAVTEAQAELGTVDGRLERSRHILRNEFQALIGNVQNDITERLVRLEDKLDRLIERGT